MVSFGLMITIRERRKTDESSLKEGSETNNKQESQTHNEQLCETNNGEALIAQVFTVFSQN
jgi:hypothetical protein